MGGNEVKMARVGVFIGEKSEWISLNWSGHWRSFEARILSLTLSIILVLVKDLSHVHYILVSHTRMFRPETENNPIHKIYDKGKCLILFNKGLGFLLEKNFLPMLIAIAQRTTNVEHHIGLTHKCIKVIYTSHLSTQLSQDLESIS
jgi:hypothetical protein